MIADGNRKTDHSRRPSFRVVGLCLLLASVSAGAAGTTTLIEFGIRDQFDRTHTDADLRGVILLIVGADRKGSQFQGRWVRELQALAGKSTDAIRVVEAADLRGVPFFVKRMVKKKFPGDPDHWVLMDWKGVLAKSYGFVSDHCNIVLFDRPGNLVHQFAVQELDAGVLNQMRRTIDTLTAGGAAAEEGPNRGVNVRPRTLDLRKRG